jgi:hypothetical protein
MVILVESRLSKTAVLRALSADQRGTEMPRLQFWSIAAGSALPEKSQG